MPPPKRAARPPKAAADPGAFAVPRTVTHAALLAEGGDEEFRDTLYLMVLAFGRLLTCREAFGRAMNLTGSQFAVVIGAAYTQEAEGVSIRALAEHVQLAPTHVTTEVGRLIRMGLLTKRPNARDRRGVLVKLSRRGEAALVQVAPFLQLVNDLLFENVSRKDFAVVSRFLRVFAANSDNAVTEIRKIESARRANGTAVAPARAAAKRLALRRRTV
jgi:DNA-binding MarR family transcriptional regulator